MLTDDASPRSIICPMPSDASAARRDVSDRTGRSMPLFIAGDQLLEGAALNAVQIAERLLT